MGDYIAAFYENVCNHLEMISETLNFARYLSVENCMVFIFIHVIIGDCIPAFFQNLCNHRDMKSETLNFARYLNVEFCIHFFLHNVGVLNTKLLNNILYLMSFTFKLANQKMTSKMTFFKKIAHKYTILCMIQS